MKLCPSCLCESPDTARFCGECGCLLEGVLPVQPASPSEDLSQASEEVSAGVTADLPPAQPYAQPEQPYAQPEQPYAQPGQTYVQPEQPYAQPAQPYAQPEQPYVQPGQTYAQPEQPYAQPEQPYAQPGQTYTQPGQTYAQPGQTYAQPGQTYSPTVSQYPSCPQYVVPQFYYPNAHPAPVRLRAMSIISLVLGILGALPFVCLFIVPPAAALTLGIISHNANRSGMSVTGIVLGSIGLAEAILIYMLSI